MSKTETRKPFTGKTVPLHKLCKSITDCHHSTPVWSDSGKIVVRNFNIKRGKLDLSTPSYTNEETYLERISRAKPEAGDLIISREAPMGEVCLIPEGIDCCLGQRMVLIKPDQNKISSKYLLYAMLSEFVQGQINQSNKTGSIVSNLRIPLLKELEIPLLNGTEGIASVLSALDAKIHCNNRINAELEAMAKTLYDYWFVQFNFPFDFARGKAAVNGKPYKSSGGKMVYNPTLKREIPVGWENGMASDLFDFNPRLSLTMGTEASYIDMNSLPVSGFMTKPPERKLFAGGTKFQNGDVVVARITPCLENGKTALISLFNGCEIGFGSTEFIVLRGKKITLSAFAAQLSRSTSFRKFAISNMTGTSGRKRIDASTLETFSLPLPPKEILLEYEKTVGSFLKRMTNNARENYHLTQLRDWLLPMLMNGQVTVA